MCKVKRLSEATTDVAPIQFQYGAMARLPQGAKIGDLLKNGYATLSVGYIGIYEACMLITGESHSGGAGMEFALQILQKMRDYCDLWSEEEGYAFQLYGTPSESTAGQFCAKDRKVYGDIKDVTDKGWYTNSFHVDVRERIDAF